MFFKKILLLALLVAIITVSGCISQFAKPTARNAFSQVQDKIPNTCKYSFELVQTENFTARSFNISITDYFPEQNFLLGNATNNDTVFCLVLVKPETCEKLTVNLTSITLNKSESLFNSILKMESINFVETKKNFLAADKCLLAVEKL